MDLRCQHCGELIIARSFGKCPGCYRNLPEDLQLSPREMELKEMEETWRSIEERRNQLGTFEIFPTITFPKEKQSGMMEETCWTTEDSRNHSGREGEIKGPRIIGEQVGGCDGEKPAS